MLIEVHLENLAVIDRLSVSFEPGFTAVTGETGAGKSLLIQALGLLAGERATAEAVRTGAEQGLVEARLEVSSAAGRACLAEQGYGDGAEIVVRRLLGAEGGHRVYVNGRMATVQLLQDVVAPELEIHAQHSQQRLLDPAVQQELLDRAAGLEGLRDEVAEAWAVWRGIRHELERLEAQGANREQEMDYLRYQLDEFHRIAPEPGELDELAAQLARIEGEETVVQAVEACRDWLRDGEGAALDRLFSAEDALRKAEETVPELADLRDRLGAVATELGELTRQVDRFGGAREEAEAVDAASLEARVSELERLARKHGGDLDTALSERDRMRANLERLEHLDEAVAELEDRASAAEEAYHEVARELSHRRRTVAGELTGAVEETLALLDMGDARIEVGGWLEGAPGPTGLDRVTFMLAANPGEPARPIRKVASGGELSRILLALQGAVGTEVDGATVVFDEVDTGIGGETALAVGARMRRLGHHSQVLAVTHTPQVAAYAHRQLHLQKRIAEGRARTTAVALDRGAREAELARMLGMREEGSAREHARTLLQNAERVEPV